MGEHLLCKQGVNGSIPFSSTRSLKVIEANQLEVESLCKQILILELVSLPWRQTTRLQRVPERVAATNPLPQTIFDN